MKAIYLVKYGQSFEAFETRECDVPEPGPEEVLIKVASFGLNFADVMARKGLYKAAPPIPSVLGYEVAGTIDRVGQKVTAFHPGENVLAFTRFGGYAEYAVTNQRAVALLPREITFEEATALSTQYCTAWYSAYDVANIREGEHVLIHAAAGGLGVALTQLAKRKGCIVYGTAGSDEKLKIMEEQGVDYPINYRKNDFAESVMNSRGEKGIDVIFDPIGGKSFKTGKKMLAKGGRIICLGASDQLNRRKGTLSSIKLLLDFGFLHPVGLLMNSITVSGVNMLQLADHKPEIIQRCLFEVVKLAKQNQIKPLIMSKFHAEQIAEAHQFFESRKSVGKIVLNW